MKILVFGAGPLGSVFAARLHEAGHIVHLLARGRRLQDLRQQGVAEAEEDVRRSSSVLIPRMNMSLPWW